MSFRIARSNLHLLLSLALLAHAVSAEFLIIPVPQKPKNIVTVAESGGQFDDVREALASITDAGPGNRYVVYIGPGTFTIEGAPLAMKNYVSLIGSGRDKTFLVGQVSGEYLTESWLVAGAVEASLEHMTIRNNGGGYYSLGVVNEQDSTAMHDLEVQAFGGTVNIAIWNFGNYAPRISNVTALAKFGESATGIKDSGPAASTIVDTQAIAEGATHNNIGIEVSTGSYLRHVEASAIGGSEKCRGIWLKSNDADIESVTLSATGPGTCVGLWGEVGYLPNPVRYSTISGSTIGVARIEAILSTTSNYDFVGAYVNCISSIDPNGTPLDSLCRPQPAP